MFSRAHAGGDAVRVFYWTDWLLPSIGGVEVFSARLLPAMAARGHDIVVVTGQHDAGRPDAVDWPGVAVRRFPFHPALGETDMGRTFELMRQVAQLKRSFQPDLVHLNTLGPSVLFQLGTEKHHPAPVLLTMHSPVADDARRQDTLYGRALRSATRINCNSRAVHADLCAVLPEMAARSRVTYYGMDVPTIAPAPRPVDDPVILGFGRLVDDKGFDLLIRAFARVHPAFPRARLVIAGEGAERAALEALAGSLGLSAHVRFVGFVAPTQVPHLLNTVSLVVVPSRWNEPFGLVALEAALMRRPVVAARVGGLPEVVDDGRTGLLVPRDDVAGLVEAISRLLAEPGTADALGAAARERAILRFSWPRCVDEYETLYEETLRRHTRPMETIHG